MNLILLIVGNILLCLLVLLITKDFLHPGFLFCIPWIVFLSCLFLSDYDYDSSSFCYIYFLVGSVLFELGCLIGHKRVKRKERFIVKSERTFHVNYQSLKCIVFAEIIFILYLLYRYFIVIRSSYAGSIYATCILNRDAIENGLTTYGRNFIFAIGICMIIGYSCIRLEEQKRYKKYMRIQLVIYLFLAASKLTRNGILFAVIPIFMAFIVVTKQNNVQIMKKMLIAIVLFLMLFVVITVMKYSYLFSDGNFVGVILDQLVVYGSGGFVAFQKQFDAMNFVRYGGANTFRFFMAIFDKIAGTNYALPLVQQFTSIGPGITTNVYTFYYWYANDFGVVYALFMQFLIGIVHGISYRKMSQMNLLGIYVYCLLIYPLVMQIFQDQYWSLSSSWIQFLILGIIFLKTDIIFSSTQKGSEVKGCLEG